MVFEGIHRSIHRVSGGVKLYSENGTEISSAMHCRQCERIALAKGIRYHVHDRTLIDGHRAIVFPD
jgi:formyltetrahydrofolate hydrolase